MECMKADSPAKPVERRGEYDAFEKLTRKLVRVPKREIDAAAGKSSNGKKTARKLSTNAPISFLWLLCFDLGNGWCLRIGRRRVPTDNASLSTLQRDHTLRCTRPMHGFHASNQRPW